jgi:hypothetical protein
MTVPRIPGTLAGVLLLAFASPEALLADLGLELVGKWPRFGNPPEAIAVKGAYAYCIFPARDITQSFESGLGIFDVSRPAAPVLIGSYPSTSAMDVFVLGNHAYVADIVEGLVVVDVGDPARPRRVGGHLVDVRQNGGGGRRVFVAGGHAYVVSGGSNSLYIFDVVHPEDPLGLGILGGVTDVDDVFISGDLAYVSGHYSGLHIFDVSDAAAPSRIGGLDSACPQDADVSVSGSHAYVKDACGIRVIEVIDPSSPKEVSRLPLECSSVFVSDGLAHCAGEGLRVFDLGDPANPRPVGSLDEVTATGFDGTPGGPIFAAAGNVFLGGTHASSGQTGLQIADVSDPTRPRWVGAAATQGSARDVTAAGGHAYVIDSFGLLVFDVSDPGSPRPVARELLNGAIDIALSEDHVLVAASSGGLAVFDVGEPRNPRLAATYRTDGPIYEVVVSGDRAHVLAGVEIEGFLVGSSLEILDIRNPGAPGRLARRPTSNSNIELIELAASEDHLYVVDAGVLDILDVSDPARPLRVGGLEAVSHLALFGDLAYVDSGGLLVLDVSDPTRPRPLGDPLQFAGNVKGIVGDGGHLHGLIANSFLGVHGLESFDVSDPARPQPAGRYPTRSAPDGLFVTEGQAYVAAGDLLILDVSHRANPERLGAHRSVRPTNGVFVSGGHAYVSTDDAGLVVLDVSDPRSPKLVGQYSGEPFRAGTTRSAVRTFVSGNFAYVAANQGGLAVIDVSDPATPRLAGAVAWPGLANHVIVHGAHAYVEDNWIGNGLWIFDVSQPELPRLAGQYAVDPSGLHTLAVAADHACLGTSFALEILALDNPANPQRTGLLEARGGFIGSTAADGLVFASNPYSDLQVIDVSRPDSPRRSGKYRPEIGLLEELFVAGKHVYAANRMTGLEVLDVSDPEDPRRVGGNRFLAGTEIRQIFVAEGAVFVAAGAEGLVVLDAFNDEGGSRPPFSRGDSSGDGKTDLSDAVYTLNYLFRGGPEPDCLEAADNDDSGAINVTDPVRLLNHLFQGGPAPEPPGPGGCGEDRPGSPDVGCRRYSGCRA